MSYSKRNADRFPMETIIATGAHIVDMCEFSIRARGKAKKKNVDAANAVIENPRSIDGRRVYRVSRLRIKEMKIPVTDE